MASLLISIHASWRCGRIKPHRPLGGLHLAARSHQHINPITFRPCSRPQSNSAKPIKMGSVSEAKANVLLVGSGGVGTMAAYALEKGGKASVTAVLRSNYKVVNEKGFDINSIQHGEARSWKPSTSECFPYPATQTTRAPAEQMNSTKLHPERHQGGCALQLRSHNHQEHRRRPSRNVRDHRTGRHPRAH